MKNYSVEAVKAIKTKVHNLDGFVTAAKEVKSLSGAVRAITDPKAWDAGFSKVAAAFGFTDRRAFTVKAVLEAVHPSLKERRTIKRDGKKVEVLDIYTRGTRKQHTGKGTERQEVLGADGRPVVEVYLKRVQSWTPALLFAVLLQSAEEAAAK